MKILMILAGLTLSFTAHAEIKFVSSCEAEFISSNPESPKFKLTNATAPYEMQKGFPHTASLTFDQYSLDLSFIWTGDNFDSVKPTLNLNFYKDGDPVQGRLNEIFVDGIELNTRTLNLPLSLRGMDFLDMNIHGHYYSRVDYICAVTRVQ